MNGGHDLGGVHGLGPIDPEPEADEPVFHAEWERRVFALTLATAALGQWSIDMGRHARERQHPADYIRHSYYENWLAGLEKLVQERGLVTAAELATGTAAAAAALAVRGRVLAAESVPAVMARGGRSRSRSRRRRGLRSATWCKPAIAIRAAILASPATCAAALA